MQSLSRLEFQAQYLPERVQEKPAPTTTMKVKKATDPAYVSLKIAGWFLHSAYFMAGMK
jgi:hypothetical protein